MFSKKFVLACLVVASSPAFFAAQAEEFGGKAAGVEIQMPETGAGMLARLDQRVIGFCGPHQPMAGLNERLAADSCRWGLMNELTFKATDIRLIDGVPDIIPVGLRRIVASSAPAF